MIKTTRVTVALDGINNLSSVRSTLYGMATGYKISTQTTHSDSATHLLESWSKSVYDWDVTQGEIVTYFTCFELPQTTVETRQIDDSWDGTIHIEMLLVDNSTIIERDFDLLDKTTLLYDTSTANKSDDDTTTEYDDSDVDISIDIYDYDTLPDVQPVGGSSGGFSGEVSDWDEEEQVGLDM